MHYQSQNLDLPDSPEGLECRNMGTMENHVWSVNVKRMKHGHRSWSRRDGSHLAKILAKKCSGKLYEVTERLRKPVFEEKVEEFYGEILMSEKVSKKDGKGYQYPAVGHMVGRHTVRENDCYTWLDIRKQKKDCLNRKDN